MTWFLADLCCIRGWNEFETFIATTFGIEPSSIILVLKIRRNSWKSTLSEEIFLVYNLQIRDGCWYQGGWKSKRPLFPPYFRKLILHFFSENRCTKVLNIIFGIENYQPTTPPPPSELFPKTQPFWYRHPSQSRVKQLYSSEWGEEKPSDSEKSLLSSFWNFKGIQWNFSTLIKRSK